MDKCNNPECDNPAGIDPPGYCSRKCENWQADTITRLRAELTVADRDAAEAAKVRQQILDESNDGYSELRAKGGE